jgi:hypothetical protein
MGSVVSSVVGAFTGADDTRDAANAAAAQQSQAAREAAAAAAFRPVGMTTRFGTSQFTRETDPRTGMPYVSSASYTAAPELSALQERLFGQFGQGLTQAEQMGQQYAPLGGAAQNLFGLGQQYLAQSPEQAAQDYLTQQRGLLAGGREQQLSGIRNKLFQTGRTGLATGGTTTGMQATNPEMAAYYNALAQQDAQLAAQATQAGQQRTQFGAGLLGTGAGLLGTQTQGQVSAYSPFQTLLGLSGNIESMAQQPYQLGVQLGQAAQPGAAAGAQMYNQGMQQAAQTRYQGEQAANAANSQFLSSLIGSAAMAGAGGFGGGGGMFSGLSSGAAGGFGMGSLGYGAGYGINPFGQQAQMLSAQW